jgi:hypothetical protein
VNKRTRLESRLKELSDSIVVNQIEAGRILAELRATFKHGEWMPYYRELVKRLGISLKTADRYREAFEQSEKLGRPILEKAKEAGLNLNRKPVRQKLSEVSATNPDASPEKIVKLTKMRLTPPRKADPKPELTPTQRQRKMFELAEMLYADVEPRQRDQELRTLANALIDHFRLDMPETEVA